jgi:hypothetical protein
MIINNKLKAKSDQPLGKGGTVNVHVSRKIDLKRVIACEIVEALKNKADMTIR